MTVKQAAERLEVSRGTVYALVSAGKLKCYRIGPRRGAIRISESHIDEYLDAMTTPSPTAAAAPPAPFPKLKWLKV